MSDQPDDQQNLEQHIPGLQQAVSNLSNLATAAGYRVATIVITQQPTRDGAPAPPTRITFAAPIPQTQPPMAAPAAQQPERWISGQPPPHQWRPGEPLPSVAHFHPIDQHQHQHPHPHPPPQLHPHQYQLPQQLPHQPQLQHPPQQTLPHPPQSIEPQSHLPSPGQRSKRASTSILDSGVDPSPPSGKRKRFSDPSGPLPSLASGAFWGTVLEERPGAPRGMMPSQFDRTPQMLESQPFHQVFQPGPPEEQQPDQIQPPLAPQLEPDRVQRSSTFPSLRIRSPLSPRQRQRVLPALPEQLAATAAGIYPDRPASPEIGPVHPRPQPERRFFRRAAGHLLGRLSPFGGLGISPNRHSASRSPVPENHLFRTRQTATSGLPAIIPAPHRAAPEMFAVPRDRAFDVPQLPPLHGLLRHSPPTDQHSGSRSASGSGVSHARPSRSKTSPQTTPIAEGSRAVTRRQRGRRASAAAAAAAVAAAAAAAAPATTTATATTCAPVPEAEPPQFFECDQCESKFKRKSDKNRHVRVVHDKSRPFQCPLCDKTFGEKSNMLKHRASVHDDVRSFRCPYCESTFSQRGLCDTHVRNVHDKKQAKYFCEHCGLPFSRKVQLNEHYEAVHPEYMASYGRLQTGQPSSVPAMASTTRPATLHLQVRGSTFPEGQQVLSAERTMQAGPSSLRGQAGPSSLRGQAGPSALRGQAGSSALRGSAPPAPGSTDPRQWTQYSPTTLPATRAELQQTPEQGSRQRSFQEDSSGGNGKSSRGNGKSSRGNGARGNGA